MNLQQALKEKITYIDKAMHTYLPQEDSLQKEIFDAMSYSIFAGGKRLRPILLLAATEFVGGNIDEALPFACAVEMIHTYSLIHDDLPAMDNDDFRRGKPTNHKIYGEGMAILAGDALLNYAFELMIDGALKNKDDAYKKILAIKEIATAAGVYGMIGGQVVDLLSENKKIDGETLEFIHKNKTAALIISSIRAGAILGGANDEELSSLTDFSKNIGLGFQITDDILDIIGDEKKLGKKIGSDEQNHKATYPSIYGLDASIQKVQKLFTDGIHSIERFGTKSEFLIELSDFLVKRDY
ncbi:polyprenyl synthetase family protein [Inediibacterium massiliense]|uniref:polyprenyl synthetase family protein n=1 Tax=Inediibacterium massiliense TaxID=1658111 RepID=UPI0006B5FB74|nr:farnesyl diphosphate synthase [Inediibacterium massiliense]